MFCIVALSAPAFPVQKLVIQDFKQLLVFLKCEIPMPLCCLLHLNSNLACDGHSGFKSPALREV
jgi:hypothetical protein